MFGNEVLVQHSWKNREVDVRRGTCFDKAVTEIVQAKQLACLDHIHRMSNDRRQKRALEKILKRIGREKVHERAGVIKLKQ